MPTGVFLPRRMDRAFSRFAGDERLKSLLALQGNPEYYSWFDDFLGDSAGIWPASANWGYPATFGTGTEVISTTAAIGGVLTLVTGANANDSAGQAVGLHWNGDSGFYFAARLKIDTIASSIIEVGMKGEVTGDTGAVATKATPTFTSADVAAFVRDTTDDINMTFVSNGGAVDGNADWSGTWAADTYYFVEIVGTGPTGTTGDNVTGYINGQRVGSGNIDGAIALTPYFYVETLTAATRTLSVDYGLCVGKRS